MSQKPEAPVGFSTPKAKSSVYDFDELLPKPTSFAKPKSTPAVIAPKSLKVHPVAKARKDPEGWDTMFGFDSDASNFG